MLLTSDPKNMSQKFQNSQNQKMVGQELESGMVVDAQKNNNNNFQVTKENIRLIELST